MSIQELQDALRMRLLANLARVTTVKGKLIEHEFLQGFLCDKDTQHWPSVVICMMSGRSILDLEP